MAKGPDFSEFDDWLEEKTGPWPDYRKDEGLSDKQNEIVAHNAELLLDRPAWHRKTDRFEAALADIEDDEERKQVRARYRIHFDCHDFGDVPERHDFSGFAFPCSVSFDGAEFGDGNVWFGGAQFGDGEVSFHHVQFGDGNVSFDDARFGDGYVSFRDTRFGDGYVSFGDARFGDGNVSFFGAQFGDGNVSFDDAEFGDGIVWFGGAQFGDGNVWFAPEKLESTTLSFQDSAVSGNLFVRTRFPRTALFTRLSVSGTANFSGCSFAETVSFSDCAFAEIPDFRDAKFDRPPEVARMDVPKPKMKRAGLFRIVADRDDVARFRKLNAMAIAANDHERDGYFFAREMMAKRGIETTGFWSLLSDSIYATLSFYGQSFKRPLCGFLASIGVFFLVYTSMLAFLLDAWRSACFSLRYSVLNSIPFLNSLFHNALVPSFPGFKTGFQTEMDSVYFQLSLGGNGWLFDWLVGASVFQQLIGGVLLFLFLLGLRNKFRLK